MAIGATLNAKRRRSRIHLGSGGLIYLIVSGVIIAAAIYTQANLLFWAFGLMTGGLVVSALLSWQMLRNIRVQRLLPSHGVAGDPLIIRYHLTNRSWLPVFSLTIMETWGRGWRAWKRTGPIAMSPPLLKARPFGWVLHIGPNQTIQAEAPCWPLRRGELKFEQMILATGFPFGILYKVVTFEQQTETLIYPHLYRVNRRMVYSLAHHDPSGRKQRERGGGTEDFFGLRAYRPGDSLKMVDWKRSARTGVLVSREMTQPSPPRMMILLDLQRDAETTAPGNSNGNSQPGSAPDHADRHTRLERAVCLTASLVCEAHFHGYQVGLAARGATCPSFPMHHSLPHRTRMLEALARLNTTPADASRAETPGSAVNPSVVVHLGKGERVINDQQGGGTILLGATDIDQFVRAFDGSGDTLLTANTRQLSRREELEAD
ncbi:DUF58 domain-containing protein [Phycisphaerales bacterium AB-hyl4]|uniref:DUF58 domain-containing protein n=1 Tax=Natronomicrosphaera hydrolytica TaxID=3242702 RepID=A0ABV4U0V1_9BACT